MSGKNNSKKEEKINFVVGLGRSGFWAAKFLRSMGKKVIVLESKENEELLEKALDCNKYFQTEYFTWMTTLLVFKKKNRLNFEGEPLKIIADFAGVLYKSSYLKRFH